MSWPVKKYIKNQYLYLYQQPTLGKQNEKKKNSIHNRNKETKISRNKLSRKKKYLNEDNYKAFQQNIK